MVLNVILYCNGRAPEIVGEVSEHWKSEIPALEASEVIRDFMLIGKQGAKRVFHCLVEKEPGNLGQIKRIIDYVENYNDGKAIQDQILFWSARTADEAYTKLWQDRVTDPFIETIAKKILRYPVDTLCDGEPCTLIVSVEDAEDVYGETIDPQKILVPHRFLGA